MIELRIVICSNLEPLDRGEMFDLPLYDLIEPTGGTILAAGTFVRDGDVVNSHIDFEVADECVIDRVIAFFINAAVPSGSVLLRLLPDETWEIVRKFQT